MSAHAQAHSQPRTLRDAASLVARTTPYLFLNLAVYFAFFLITLAWWGVTGGLALMFANRGAGLIGSIFFLLAIAGPPAALRLGRRYLLYLVKGGHIATLTALVLHGEVPDGKGQVEHGRAVVRQRFADVSALAAVDLLVQGALRAISRQVVRIVDWLPLPVEAASLARMATQIFQRSLTYVDEAILSYAIARDEDSVWRSARHGVVLYGQSYKPILMTALKVWLVGKVLLIALLALFAIPAGAVLAVTDSVMIQGLAIGAAILLAFIVELAVYEPFAMAATLLTYHHTIAGAVPDPVWDERLQKASDKFREIVGRSREAGSDPLDALPETSGSYDPLGSGVVSPAPEGAA